MKRHLWKYTALVFVLGIALFTVETKNHIPINAGGSVDVAADLGRISAVEGRLKMVRYLSQQLNQHPKDNRFRVSSNWGDCGIAGKRVLVYDRGSGTLLTWSESHSEKSWSRKLSRADYKSVTDTFIDKAGNINEANWRGSGRKFLDFDFLLGYGCKKTL